MEKVLFIILAVIAVGAAINMVVQRNPLYGALSLIGTLASLSALYVTLRAQFIAAMQIVVYAGAIMVLFVFVIMLLNTPKEEPRIEKHKWLGLLAIPFAVAMLAEALLVLTAVKPIEMPAEKTGVSSMEVVGTTANVGRALFTDYLLPFEVTSVLILMAVVGAIVLGRREERRGNAPK
jgi:NADH-quinone oxidoreductase subunit J